MTSVYFIHPSVHDVPSFLSFTCMDGFVELSPLKWDAESPDILFASEWTFYRKDLFDTFRRLYGKSRIKVAWMGEAVAADPNVFDYFVGFDAGRESDPRFIRILSPLDMFHRFISTCENPIKSPQEAIQLLDSKPLFCNFLYSNPDAHPMRDRIFHTFNAFERVDSLGKHLNNTGAGATGYGGHYADCTLLKEKYRFSIASENACYDGYTTEKIFTSLAAHTVPIYWGNPSIADDVNPECFVNVADYDSLDDAVDAVAKINDDPRLWAEMVSRPWFTPSQEEQHRRRTRLYRESMMKILDGEAKPAVPEGYHVGLYRRRFFDNAYAFDSVKGFPHLNFKGKALKALEILSPLLTDGLFIRCKFRLMLGRWPDLKHHRTFNELLQWHKLHDRDRRYVELVDKAAVKDIVRSKVGPDHVIPTLGVWSSPDEIDFDHLPDSFVLKCTHDSGSVVIVRDKSSVSREQIRQSLEDALRRDYSRQNREWPYHFVPRRVIAEPYLSDLDGATDDYKFFCSDGRVRFLFVATGRFRSSDETRFDFFDRDWNHLPFTNGHPMADTVPQKPAEFESMVKLAERLSEGLPLVRVDLYNLNGRILFGEYTFSHWGGFKPFNPPQWDLKLGQMLQG